MKWRLSLPFGKTTLTFKFKITFGTLCFPAEHCVNATLREREQSSFMSLYRENSKLNKYSNTLKSTCIFNIFKHPLIIFNFAF